MNDLTQLTHILLGSLIALSLIYFGVVLVIANKHLSKAKEDEKFIKIIDKCPPHSYTYFGTRDGEYLQCTKCNFIPKDSA
jgi:hypothetical protein